ncbi:MAG: hypothetical protein LBU74_07510 [Methanobacteriaceae archaeon]|nr:hypothetical protein [Candidatus Methanorudis spinitermitis]
MDKKLIGLILITIIAVVAVSGCIGDDDSSMEISNDNDQVNDDIPQKTESPLSGKDSSRSNNNPSDPEPNEEPEPPADE